MVLRVLIGIACVAVIGFVAMAAWDRYEASRLAAERASFESFCDLQYDVAEMVRREGREPAPHVREGMAQCQAAGLARIR